MAKSKEEIEEWVAPIPRNVIHLRNCNRQVYCNCAFSRESKLFHQHLAKRTKRDPNMKKIQNKMPEIISKMTMDALNLELKRQITSFLTPKEIAFLSMLNHDFHNDAVQLAQMDTVEFVRDVSKQGKFVATERQEKENIFRHIHHKINSIYRIFVYYTAYNKGSVRQEFPHWTFGVIDIDPNAPHLTILPNEWTFHEFAPWVRRKTNGKDGEWVLQKNFRREFPKEFIDKVKDWYLNLRPGSLLAIAYMNVDATEKAWWEAQVWYTWRAGVKPELARVIGQDTNDVELRVEPDELLTHFQANPLHVIDITKNRSVCEACLKRNRNFFQCHVDHGHRMVPPRIGASSSLS